MKNCEEMVGSLLRRRAEYEVKQRKRRQTMMRISGAACSLALMLFIGAGVDRGWWVTQEPTLPTATPTQGVAEPTAAQPQQPTETEEPVVIVLQPEKVENHIVIHEIDSISEGRMYIALLWDDFVPMTDAELNNYFGMDIFPVVPGDLGEEWCVRQNTQKGIYRRDGGTGEVYHDQQVLNWSNEDFTRTVNIELKKGGMPFQCFAVQNGENACSVIGGVEVFIGRNDDGIWLVEFLYQEVGFRMIAEGLTQEELVAVISSLIL